MTAPVERAHNVFQDKYGLSDIVGNVSEWCLDLLTWDSERVTFDSEIKTADKFSGRILWGSSWDSVGPLSFDYKIHYHAGGGILPGSEFFYKTGFRLFAR